MYLSNDARHIVQRSKVDSILGQEERRVLSQERVAGGHVIRYVGMFIHMTRIHNLIEMFGNTLKTVVSHL